MKIKRNSLKVLSIGLLAFALAACSGGTAPKDEGSTETAPAVEYPTKDIRMVVSYAAGGPTDVAGRAIAAFMEKDLGVSIVVENKEGAAGAVGTAEVARATPDGYTISMTTASAIGRVPLTEDVGYKLEDIQPIGVGTYGPGILIVRADSPYQTIDDLVKYAKANPSALKFATVGPSSPQHVELVRMSDDYGVTLEPVPFQGEAPAVTALLGENVDGCFCSNAQTTMAQVDAGEFRILATGAPEPVASLPGVPTLAESGFKTIIYGNSYFVLAAPTGIPAEVLEVLEGSMERAMKDEATLAILGAERVPDKFMGAAATSQLLADEQAALSKILTEMFSS